MRDARNVAEGVSRGLAARHFESPIHGRIFDACIEVWCAGEPLDMEALSHRVGREHLPAMAECRAAAPLTQNFGAFAQALIDGRRQVEIQARLMEVSRAMTARRPMEPIGPMISRIAELVAFACGDTPALKTTSVHESVTASLKEVEERVLAQQNGRPIAIPTGFSALDRALYGFQPGFVYILGARPAVGKTTMALNMLLAAAQAGFKSAFVTVEMSDVDIADKAICKLSRVNMGRYLSGSMTEDELDRLMVGARKLNELPILFTEVSQPTMSDLEFECLRLVRVEGVKLIVVDYLQLFESGDNRRTSREETKNVSARLKGIARRLKVPLLVLSQLNREAPDNAAPDLKHIAECDNVVRDADVVMFLYRIDDEHFISVAKQRRGSDKSTTKLVANLHFSSFENGT